eukprot:TRINITY_DN12126_c0_g1_i2.p1 TRINITY_DN12126_c0_g1~~TRINITY_DN12126_c0_g1_i2.p1  ORF type:complete len:480 (+),score=141.99 TRINITY_DN12126_c0_g1_i2:160-1599(+)
MRVEARNASFDACLAESVAAWEAVLGRVQVSPASNQSSTKFYTALYHSLLAPTMVHDADRRYRGMDGAAHVLPSGMDGYASDMSLWDVHRTQLPLLNLVLPEQAVLVVHSLAQMALDGGGLPRWPLADVYTGCMVGNHANVAVLDTALKAGLGALNRSTWEVLLAAMLQGATNSSVEHGGRTGLQQCLQHRYCPQDMVPAGSALTLAYAFDDWAIAGLAALLGGHNSTAGIFAARAQWYKNVWNQEHNRFCPRHSNGTWACTLLPESNEWVLQGNKRWVEGNEAQWRWFAPFDVEGLVGLFPSQPAFVTALDAFMTQPQSNPSTALPNGGYWAGNEPDILAPWLFSFAGREDLTQQHTRWLVQHRYGSTADTGLPGNDDYGTLSAWLVWACLGLYPVSGRDLYVLGSPMFERATLHRAQGDILIVAHNQSEHRPYVQRFAVDGVVQSGQAARVIAHSRIAAGATLEFWMSQEPHQQAAT